MGNNLQFDPCIFWAVDRSIQVKKNYIESSKPCAWTRKGAVYYQLQYFHRTCRCCNIPRLADTISCYSYVCTIWFVLVMSDITNHTSVTYLLPTVVRNIFKFYDLKGVCAINTLLLWSACESTGTLAKPPEFIGIICVPNLLIFWVTENLSIFHWFPSFIV